MGLLQSLRRSDPPTWVDVLSASDTNYVRVNVRTTDGQTINGKVNVAEADRLSEVFTQSGDSFVVLVDANSETMSGDTLVINKRHVIWVQPES